MDITFFLSAVGSFLLIALLIWFCRRPIERDRILFGERPQNILQFSVAIIVFGVLALCFSWNIIKRHSTNKDYLVDINRTMTPEAMTLSITQEHPDTILAVIKAVQDSNLKKETDMETFWAVVSQFADPGNLPTAGGRGRWFALLCAMAGIVCLSGLMVSSLVNLISGRTRRWRQGLIHYRKGAFRGKHVVIIGVNDQTATIVKKVLERGMDEVKYVLIQTRQDVEQMRMRLDLDLETEEEKRLVFYFAERTSREDIEKLRLESAVEIYILGEDVDFVNEQDHDAFNINCVEHVSQYLKEYPPEKSRGRIRCHVNLEYQSTFTAFKSTHIYKSLDKNVEFVPFNVHDIWAKKVLVDNYAVVPTGKKGEVTIQNYRPIDSEDGIKVGDDQTVHLIIVGMNQMGTALASQAALIAHYPNFHRDRRLRTTITFIDDNARVEGEYYRGRFSAMFDLCPYRVVDSVKGIDSTPWFDPMEEGRYRHLKDVEEEDGNFMDIRWEFIQGDVASEEVRHYLISASENTSTYTTIAICFNHPQRSIAAALYLPEMVLRRAMQILVYQQNIFDLINKVGTGEKVWKRYEKLKPFGMIERSYTENPFDNASAKILYFLYSEKKFKQGDPSEELFSFHQVEDISEFDGFNINARLVQEINDRWNQQGIVRKLSNIDMVDSIPTKLRSLGLTIDTIAEFDKRIKVGRTMEFMAKSEHTRWLVEQLTMGYRPLDLSHDKAKREWVWFIENQNCSTKKKNRHKSFLREKSRAHLDICSFDTLLIVDPDCKFNDKNVVLYIPQVIRYAQWVTVMKMADLSSQKSNAQHLFFDANAMRPVGINGNQIWIMDTVVTQKQWKKIMGNNPSRKKFHHDSKPVVNVSKNDIDDFIKALNKKTGLWFDLPSLGEWENIAKQSSVEYMNGLQDSSKLKRVLWYERSKGPQVVRRWKKRQANQYGIYDILGNVWEWTKDTKPSGEDDSLHYCFCGGSWKNGKECCLLTERIGKEDVDWCGWWTPDLESDDIGFRLVWRFDISHLANQATIRDNIAYLSSTNRNRVRIDAAERLDRGRTFTEDKIRLMLNQDNFVFVKGGYFAMVKDKETCFVKIGDYYMQKTPVTQRLWNLVLGIASSANPSTSNIGDDYPQTDISWNDAKSFIKNLNAQFNANFRLPTSAEWEYAAKEGQNCELNRRLTEIWSGQMDNSEKNHRASDVLLHLKYKKYSGSNDAEVLGLGRKAISFKVMQYEPNALELYDMSGCVSEWCEDCAEDESGKQCKLSNIDAQNGYLHKPICSNRSHDHVWRSGGWKAPASLSECTYVGRGSREDKTDDLGLRLVIGKVDYEKLLKRWKSE